MRRAIVIRDPSGSVTTASRRLWVALPVLGQSVENYLPAAGSVNCGRLLAPRAGQPWPVGEKAACRTGRTPDRCAHNAQTCDI